MMTRVFVCSPLAGDIEGNIERARAYCAFVLRQGLLPYAPHLFFPQFLNEHDPAERELGITLGLVELANCRELWAFGERVSEGMRREIARANELGIRVRLFLGVPVEHLESVKELSMSEGCGHA